MYGASGIGKGKDLEELLEKQLSANPDDDVYATNLATNRVGKSVQH
jgi:hypothetical protein